MARKMVFLLPKRFDRDRCVVMVDSGAGTFLAKVFDAVDRMGTYTWDAIITPEI